MSARSSEAGPWPFDHEPVLLDAVITELKLRPDGSYVDATVGGAGHAAAIYERLGKGGRLLGIDRDPAAVAVSETRLGSLAAQRDSSHDAPEWTVQQARFGDLDEVMDACWGDGSLADGILADLGVSSPQLDSPGRGFSYHSDGPLDMRMNPGEGETALDLIRRVGHRELSRILAEYGEERYAGRIARRLQEVAQECAQEGRELTTAAAAAAIAAVMPASSRREAQHPARRSFQALRIAVNDELGELERLLTAALERLENGGRLLVISFHSLEDRIVKHRMRHWQNPCECPAELPCSCGKKSRGRVIVNRGLVADEDETRRNPRARSARLRIFERQDDLSS
ncbi:MAG: 16S rRNA (cytosine(1402)-N(4))-methyltransferase RsmH [Bacillota bacterium]|nr:16S rRNA (cytosine(1402)-N(4))-methyltransferase RsmH [Bacillota bacterium]